MIPKKSKMEAVDAQAKVAAPPGLKTDASVHSRLGWWLVIAGLGGFLLWAFLAPLDQGVPMSGTVTVSGNKKSVQHLSGGTVDDILVKEGDQVKAGQVLLKMNSVQARATAEGTRVQYLSALVTEARLLAERDEMADIVFPPEVLKAAEGDPRLAATVAVQRQLFVSRRTAVQGEVSALQQNIEGLQAFAQGTTASRVGKLSQARLLKRQIDDTRDLAQEGYMPRNRLLELERSLAQIESGISEDDGSLGRSQKQVAELRLRIQQLQLNRQQELRAQLADVKKETDALRNRLEGLEYEVNNAEVRAPVDGIVSDVAVFTEGGVVPPGFRLMDVVPLDEPLIVEGQVPVHLIDSVRPGLPVELIFSSFNQNTTPRIPGTVSQVAPDRVVDEKSGIPYYRLRAEITPEGKAMLTKLAVRPGMPVDLFVNTGERTMASYLFKPVADHFRMALTEE
jgi:membrane fusion protein, protease secretion system